jgi:hypothetical protein
LDDDVFAIPRTPELLTIILSGFIGRHRVVVDAGPHYNRWHEALDAWSTLLVDETLVWSIREEATEPARHTIRVRSVPQSRWSLPVPEVMLDDAVRLLAQPFRLLLEHRRDDFRFLLMMCTAEERMFLRERVEAEWLEVETCGGITEVEVRATELRETWASSVRAAALCDSDALEPGQPDLQAKRVQKACDRLEPPGEPIHHHILERRTIENYLPIAVLEGWRGRARTKDRAKRDALLKAFRALSSAQKAHFPMKKGLNGDMKRSQQGPLFVGMTGPKKDALAEGFGRDIAAQTMNGVTEAMLRHDGTWLELRPFVNGLIARMR